jgi:hypothetical protein
MSAGTPVTTVRLPPALRVLIDHYLEKRNELTTVAPWTLTDFLIEACRELLRKKAWRKRRAVVIPSQPPIFDEEIVDLSINAQVYVTTPVEEIV